MKKILIFLLCVFVWQTAPAAGALKIIVPYAVGGPTDRAARIVQISLSHELRRPVIVENKPGAGGLIGIMSTIRPDSKEPVILITGGAPVISGLTKEPPSFVQDQLIPMAHLGHMDFVLVSSSKFGIKSIHDWRKIDKSRPIMMGSVGSGSSTEIITNSFNQIMDKNIVLVPYKGQGPMLIDLLSGNLDGAFLFSTLAVEHIKNNKLFAVAVTSPSRLSDLPDTPSFKETGINGLSNLSWNMVFSNQSNDKQLIKTIQHALEKILQDPAIIEKFQQTGIDVSPLGVSATSFFENEKNKFLQLRTLRVP